MGKFVPAGTHHEQDEHDPFLDAAGFYAPDDSWLERVREADLPLPLGTLGPYQLQAEIGRGGQGVVYKAQQPGTNRQIALKRLVAGSFATPTMRRRIEREVEALTALDHPHIVTVFAMDMIDGVPVLVMEWIDGVPITTWATRTTCRRSPAELTRMLMKVCRAIHHAHQRGVIHRDLKPSNILIDAADEPHVLDFGLAKLIPPGGAGDDSLTLTDHFVGTLSYASPEQLAGQPGEVDVRSDVYSMGVIGYEILTGGLPYTGNSLAAITQAIQHAEPVRPVSVSRMHRDLEAILLKALAKDKQARYQSLDAFAADLRCHLSGESVTARLPGSLTQFVSSMRRHRIAVAFAATVFALIMTFAIVAATLALRLAEQRDLAIAAQRRETQARGRSEQQAAKAEAISSFLQHMLASPEPVLPNAPDTTVREVLDAAAGRIESDLAQEDQAAVRLVIGNAFHNLGLYEPAEFQLRTALRLYRDRHGDMHPDVVITLSRLAELLHTRGDHPAAADITSQAVVLYRQVLQQGHALVEADLTGMAAHLCMNGEAEAAESLYREALSTHTEMFGKYHPVVADDLRGLSSLLCHLNKCDEVLALARKTLEMRRTLVGDQHPDVADDLYNLGNILNGRGEPAAAEPVLRQVLARRRELLDDGHPQVAEAVYVLALTQAKMSNLEEATALFLEACELRSDLYGPDHEFVASCLAQLGRFAHEQGDHVRAQTHLETALQIFRRDRGPHHWRTAYVENDLGNCLSALQQHGTAEPLLLRSYEIIKEKRGQQHERTREAWQRITDLYLTWDKPDPPPGSNPR